MRGYLGEDMRGLPCVQFLAAFNICLIFPSY